MPDHQIEKWIFVDEMPLRSTALHPIIVFLLVSPPPISKPPNSTSSGEKARLQRVTMPLCSFYASTSLPVAKPHPLPSSARLPSTAAAAITTVQPTMTPVVAASATTAPTMAATTAAEALSLHLPELPSEMRDKILSLELMGVDYGRALSLNRALRDVS